MKTIQALGWYFPEASGGTEVFVQNLAHELRPLGIESVVCAPRAGHDETHYTHEGIDVYRYPMSSDLSRQQIAGEVPPDHFDQFARWLEAQKADLYQQHSWTTGCGVHHLRWAKKLGLPTVTTIHVPGNVCLRGTLMLNGKSACDGKIDEKRCGSCWAESRGAPAAAARWVSQMPMALSRTAHHALPESRLTSLLATQELVSIHRDQLLELASLSDTVVAVCQWLYDALVLNGVPENKLVICRQGIEDSYAALPRSLPARSEVLRVGFLGRLDPVKGLHLLVEALRRLPQKAPIELIIHGLSQGGPHAGYEQKIRQLISDDARIRMAPALSRQEVPTALSGFDILAVPSQWFETGPLVVLEAQALGIPILGSNLGGISELVRHGVNGWLLPAFDVNAWTQALQNLISDRALLDQWRGNRMAVRTMKQVAAEMSALYKGIVS